MRNVRMCETDEQASCRKETDKLYKRNVRMYETDEQALCIVCIKRYVPCPIPCKALTIDLVTSCVC